MAQEAIKISPSRGAEQAELERLRAALAASADVIYDWDIATDAIHWSPKPNRTFGLHDSVDLSTRARYLGRVNSDDLG